MNAARSNREEGEGSGQERVGEYARSKINSNASRKRAGNGRVATRPPTVMSTQFDRIFHGTSIVPGRKYDFHSNSSWLCCMILY